MRSLLIALMLLVSSNTYAACSGTDFSHVAACERFTLIDDPSQMAHFWFANFSTVAGTRLLEKAGMNKWQAIPSAAVLSAMAVTAQELFFNGYYSRPGTKAAWYGAATGAVLSFTLEF